MSGYTKKIQIDDWGVETEVRRNVDGAVIQHERFQFWPWHPMSWSLEMRLKRAHKWADKVVALAEKYEIPEDKALSSLRTDNLMRELGLKL